MVKLTFKESSLAVWMRTICGITLIVRYVLGAFFTFAPATNLWLSTLALITFICWIILSFSPAKTKGGKKK